MFWWNFKIWTYWNRLNSVCNNNSLKTFVRDSTCFKDPNLLLTDRPQCFQHKYTFAFETGISDFLKMTVTLMKILINSKNQKQFNTEIANTLMRNLLILKLSNELLKIDINNAELKEFSKQQNVCVSILLKTKSNYFSNLDTNMVKDNRKFRKTVNPIFSKCHTFEKICLINLKPR